MAGLFVSAFLSATLLPGNSELALAAWLHLQPSTVWQALLWASLGNTLGGYSTFWLGRRIPRNAGQTPSRALAMVQRWGVAALLLSWLPILGDALCLAAGWLRLPRAAALAAIFCGKALRYGLIALPWLIG